MLDSQNISKTLKDRARAIHKQYVASNEFNGAMLVLSGVLIAVAGFITALVDFEYYWYFLTIGLAVGVVCAIIGKQISARNEVPIKALELFAYGEILDRMNQEESTPKTTPVAPPKKQTAAQPKPQPAAQPKPQTTVQTKVNPKPQNNEPPVSNPSSHIHESLPTWKRIQLEKEGKLDPATIPESEKVPAWKRAKEEAEARKKEEYSAINSASGEVDVILDHHLRVEIGEQTDTIAKTWPI